MQLHPFRVEPDDGGSLRVISQYGVLLGHVWRRRDGDDLVANPYGAAAASTK
jgi:hypothetical protein